MRCAPPMLGILLALALAAMLACGRDDAGQTAEAVRDTAAEATEAAREGAQEAGEAAEAMADEAGRAVPDVAAGAPADPVARCRELAAREAWAEALEPCTAAHREKPDDMAIEHALQQARAASE